MSTENGIALHDVCTLQEARTLVRGRPNFWVSDCGCRTGRGGCRRARIDVCHFGARTLRGGTPAIDRELCHGRGLCVDACPLGSIRVVPRTPEAPERKSRGERNSG